ncbi:hypothetical protein STRDD11_01961 [Streptococcus sp. DD11]|nr:hypothetical protein STRDD11_01961 [Streptococcus sp. DD11]
MKIEEELREAPIMPASVCGSFDSGTERLEQKRFSSVRQ